jgi:hypothetical protein
MTLRLPDLSISPQILSEKEATSSRQLARADEAFNATNRIRRDGNLFMDCSQL